MRKGNGVVFVAFHLACVNLILLLLPLAGGHAFPASGRFPASGFRRVAATVAGEWVPRDLLATGSPVYGSERELPESSTRAFGLRRPHFFGWLRSLRRKGMLDLCECPRDCAGLAAGLGTGCRICVTVSGIGRRTGYCTFRLRCREMTQRDDPEK